MREENPQKNGVKSSKFGDQNQPPKSSNNVKGNNPPSKLKSASSWSSHIVKGFSGEKKSKQQKSVTTKKVHPQALNSSNSYNKSFGSRDLLLEIENLRGFLKESKERESKLRAELLGCKGKEKNLEVEKEVEAKRSEVDELVKMVNQLQFENKSLNECLLSLTAAAEMCKLEGGDEEISRPNQGQCIEMEAVQLRRLNKELQLQKRDLACRVATLESQLAALANASESDIIAKTKAEALLLKNANEDLSKQVEGLQLSRLNEVEELAYLRWVNSCLRDELHNSCLSMTPEIASGSEPIEDNTAVHHTDYFLKSNGADRLQDIRKQKNWANTDVNILISECPANLLHKNLMGLQDGQSPTRQTISGCDEDLTVDEKRQSDGFTCLQKMVAEQDQLNSQTSSAAAAQSFQHLSGSNETNKFSASVDVKRALRVPNPPPRPSCSNSDGAKEAVSAHVPTPPPPPPPPPPLLRFSGGSTTGAVQRVPQVVELYHSLMRRESRRDSSAGAVCEAPSVANARSNMIGEIENRSSYLLAIKADVETQGEFVNSLIKEVNGAIYRDIEDVVAFVKWLDDELCYLVDERAVLKHFDWPEKKADTLREAAFGYKDLKKLESEVTYYKDDPRIPCDLALKKMVSLSEKMERTVHNILRTRESLMHSCKEFQIPTDWMLDSGIISKVKLGSVKLAKKYMKRVAMELQSRASFEKDPGTDYMLLQGVRFAFRIHQFAGGFDAETMQAFEELRKLAHVLNKR